MTNNTIANVPRELLLAKFENWHNKSYGPQGEFNPVRSLDRWPENAGLGYQDSTVQAQFFAFCGALELSAPSPAGVDGLEPSGHDDLWLWFGSSRSSWLTLPRSLMHAMPDEWQKKMAGLLDLWDAAWNTAHLPAPYVSAREGAKFTRWPEWLLNYRRPAQDEIDAVRALSAGKEGE